MKTINDCLKELDLYKEYISVQIPLKWAKETGFCRHSQYPNCLIGVHLFESQIPTFEEFKGSDYTFWSKSKSYLSIPINKHLW